MFHYKTDYPVANDSIYLKIKHGVSPDMIIRHLPETTLISVICNFGGILGMWLGLSVLTITEEIFIMLNKLINIRKIRPLVLNLGQIKLFKPRITLKIGPIKS